MIVQTAEAAAALREVATAAGEAAAAVRTLQGELDALHGKTVDIGVDAANAMGEFTTAVDKGDQALIQWAANLSDASRLQMQTTRILRETGGVYDTTARSVEDLHGAYLEAEITNAEFNRTAANTAHSLDDAMVAAMAVNAGVDEMTARLGRAGAGFAATGVAAAGAAAGWTIFGVAAGTVVHWVIAAGAEFLAVAIPALVAGGSAALVAAQGFQDVQTHLTAVYAATEATANIFHTTAGQFLGLKDVLQQAQNAANPRVFELLGAGLNIAKADAGGFVSEGTKVLGVLDNFAAKVTAELTGALGAQLHGLLAGGVKDLTEFGQVLGNVGHAVINLASDMPGLANVLLSLLAGASRLVEWFTTLPGAILTAAFALEEFWRWGGLAASIISRLFSVVANIGPIIAGAFGAVAGTAQRLVQAVVGGVGLLVTNVGKMTVAFGEMEISAGLAGGEIDALGAEMIAVGGAAVAAGVEIEGFGAAIAAAAAEITPLQGLLALAAVAGFAFLAVKAVAAGEAMSHWAVSAEQAVQSASSLKVIPTITDEMTSAANHYAQAQGEVVKQLHSTQGAAGSVESRYTGMSQAMQTANAHVAEAASVQGFLDRAMQNTLTGAGLLEDAYGTTFVGALALADAAGVKLAQGITGTSVAATDARIKIANYVAGMQAMGETSSTVGHDVTLLGIASALAGTHIQQLQQAFSGFVTNMTAGTSNLAAMNTAIHNMGVVSTSTGKQLQLSMGQAASALRNFGATGSQVWQNFDSALSGSASSLVQWFQLAGTEGAVQGPQFAKGIMDVVASFQQVAAKSPAARAELVGFANAAGMNVSSWADLERQLKATGATGAGLPGIISAITGRMANMNAVARALGSSLGTSVVASMNSARVAASGLSQSAQSFSVAWNHAHAVTASVVTGFRATYTALSDIYHNTTMARTAVDAFAQQIGLSKTQISALNTAIDASGTAARSAASGYKAAEGGAGSMDTAVKAASTTLMTHAVNAKAASLASQNFGQQASAAGHAATGLATNANAANTAVRTLGTSANTTRGSLGTVNNEIHTTAAAAGASGGPLGSMAGSIRNVGSAASAAAGQVRGLEAAIASLQSKSITVTTNFVTTHTGRQHGGPVAAGIPYTVGEAGRETFVPSVPGYILSNPDTERFMSSPGGHGGPAGGGGGPTTIHLEATIPVTASVDQGVLFSAVKQQTLQYNTRNSGSRTGKLVPLS